MIVRKRRLQMCLTVIATVAFTIYYASFGMEFRPVRVPSQVVLPPPLIRDPMLTALKQGRREDFEQGLREYLATVTVPTEASDLRLKDLTDAIENEISTSNDRQYFLWRVPASRLILQQYKPVSSKLSAVLAKHLAYVRPFFTFDREIPSTKDRYADAQLILETLKRIQDAVDRDFDEKDFRNWPMVNVGIPGGGGRYLPGISPEDIAEPEIRENYLKAIAKNQEKIKTMQQKKDARHSEKDLKETANRFVRTAYLLPPLAVDEMKELLTKLAVDSDTQDEIIAEATRAIAESEKLVKENLAIDEELEKLRAEGVIDDPTKK